MGMYSWFEDENVEVTDWDGLVSFMNKWKEEFPESWINNKEYQMIDLDKKEFTFSNWNNLKIISYWYNDIVAFLQCIAQYIEGEVSFEFENKDEAGWLKFADKKCIIHTGQMTWQSSEPKELFREESSLQDEEETKKLKKFMMVGCL